MRQRHWLLAGLLLALALLCGCTENKIACGVDGQNNAYLHYEFNVDTTGMDPAMKTEIWSGLRQLEVYYRYDLGFTASDNFGQDPTVYHLEMTLRRPGDSPAQALTLLGELLQDPTVSPFTGSVTAQQADSRISTYTAQVRLEANRLLDTAGLENFPQSLEAQLRQAVDTAKVELELTLPASELPQGEEAVLENGLARKTVQLSFTEPTELKLTTLQTDAETTVAAALEDLDARAATAARRERWALILGVLALVTGLVLLLVPKKK